MRGLERVGSDCQTRVSAGSKPGDEQGVGVGESRQPATHPLDHLVWNGGLDSPGRAGGADPLTRDAVRATDARSGSGGRPPFASSHTYATPARDKSGCLAAGRTANSTAARDAASRPGGKRARRITGAPAPNPQITPGNEDTLQRLASGVRNGNEGRALWFLARLSKALYDRLMPMNSDPSLLRAALVGYENQLQKIDQAISDLRQRLHLAPASASQPASGRLRTLSAGARRRIAAAQKKRWAAYRKSKGAGK